MVRKVRDHGTLAAVVAMEAGGILIHARGILYEGRALAAGVVAVGRFDLDHVGAEVGQRLSDPWASQDLGKLNHLEPCQGADLSSIFRLLRAGES